MVQGMDLEVSRDLIIVPTYDRPEMLFHALDRLSKARHIEEHDVWIRADWHTGRPPSKDNLEVATMFPHLKPHFSLCPPHDYWGNTYNFMHFYIDALATQYRYVYMVECDVFVAEDFFDWHRAVQEAVHPMASIAVRHYALEPYMSAEAKADPRRWVLVDTYASLGVCWKRENLAMILEYFNPDYLTGLLRYLDEKFPNSSSLGRSGSQDGLISRLLERDHLVTVFPTRPRAFHGGWYGFNRSQQRRPTGTLHQNIDAVGRALADKEYLLAEGYDDCTPCDLSYPNWHGELIEWKR